MTEIVYSQDARKSLKKIPQNYQKRIAKAIEVDLKANPLQNPMLKNSGDYRRHKNKVAPYRIIYRISNHQAIEILNIVLIGHHKNIYDKLKRINIR